MYKAIYVKTKFQLTYTISGLTATKLNITTPLFQMTNKKRMWCKPQYKYISKLRAPNKNALFSSTLTEFFIGSFSCNKSFL